MTIRRWEARQVASISRVTPATATQACVATLLKCFILSPVFFFACFLIIFSSFSAPFLSCNYFSFFYNLLLSSSPIVHSFLYFPFIYLHVLIYLSLAFLFSLTVLPFSPHVLPSSFLILHFFPSRFLPSLSVASTTFTTSKMSHPSIQYSV